MIADVLQEALDMHKPIVVFCDALNRNGVERKLLSLLRQKAFYEHQVTTFTRYALDRVPDVKLLSQGDLVQAVLASMKSGSLPLFSRPSTALVRELARCYQIMADIDLTKEVSEDPFSRARWDELKRLYERFREVRNGVFATELYDLVIPYLEDAVYVDLQNDDGYLSHQRFLDASGALTLPVSEKRPGDLYVTQYPHEEIAAVIEMISDGLKQGRRLRDFAVYVPDATRKLAFLKACPYPCQDEPAEVDMVRLKKRDEILALEAGDVKAMVASIKDQLNIDLTAYDIHDFRELKIYLEMMDNQPLFTNSNGRDRITVLTYDTPLLSQPFDTVFLTGLNDGVYPHPVRDQGFLHENDLRHYYEITPSRVQLQNAEKVFNHICGTARHCCFFYHEETLAGETCLPSELISHFAPRRVEPAAGTRDIAALLAETEERLTQKQVLTNAKDYYGSSLSPYALETFASCPFRYFLKYGMNLKTPSQKWEAARHAGLKIHDLLDKLADLFAGDFFAALGNQEEKLELSHEGSLDERLARLLEKMSDGLEAENAEEAWLYSLLPERAAQLVKILAYQHTQGHFQLAYHEKNVHGQWDGYEFAGRVDRADVFRDYLMVLDYKSSQKKLDPGLALEGFNIQLLVYLLLLSEDKIPGAVLYFNSAPKNMTGKGKWTLPENGAQDFLKLYRLDGLIRLDDKHDVLYGLDEKYRSGDVVKARYVKSQDAISGDVLEAESFDLFLGKIKDLCVNLARRIQDEGAIDIAPAGSFSGNVNRVVNPCPYCDYRLVCLRDPFYHEGREVHPLKKDDVLTLLKGAKKDG